MKKALFLLSALGLLQAGDIVITGNDSMQFSQKEITLEAGKATKITFKHIGNLPKTAMGHNLVILKPGTAVPAFASSCMTAAANDYIPTDAENKKAVVAHTKMLGGGQEDSIEVTLEAGTYPFLCSFPGHFALMSGVITVK